MLAFVDALVKLGVKRTQAGICRSLQADYKGGNRIYLGQLDHRLFLVRGGPLGLVLCREWQTLE